MKSYLLKTISVALLVTAILYFNHRNKKAAEAELKLAFQQGMLTACKDIIETDPNPLFIHTCSINDAGDLLVRMESLWGQYIIIDVKTQSIIESN